MNYSKIILINSTPLLELKKLETFQYENKCVQEGEENDMPRQILRTVKKQLIDLKQHLERYVKTLP